MRFTGWGCTTTHGQAIFYEKPPMLTMSNSTSSRCSIVSAAFKSLIAFESSRSRGCVEVGLMASRSL